MMTAAPTATPACISARSGARVSARSNALAPLQVRGQARDETRALPLLLVQLAVAGQVGSLEAATPSDPRQPPRPASQASQASQARRAVHAARPRHAPNVSAPMLVIETTEGREGSEGSDTARLDGDATLLDRPFCPASTFKIAVAWAGLRHGLVTPGTLARRPAVLARFYASFGLRFHKKLLEAFR